MLTRFWLGILISGTEILKSKHYCLKHLVGWTPTKLWSSIVQLWSSCSFFFPSMLSQFASEVTLRGSGFDVLVSRCAHSLEVHRTFRRLWLTGRSLSEGACLKFIWPLLPNCHFYFNYRYLWLARSAFFTLLLPCFLNVYEWFLPNCKGK